MDIRQLQYFLAIVEHGGFARAAHQAHVSQPSLSQAMAALERDLGTKLFHRLGRGVVLTQAGQQLVEPARGVLRGLRTAREAVESVEGLMRGSVELVTMPAPGIEPLTTLTRRVTLRHPGLTMRIAAAFSPDEVVDRLKRGIDELGLAGVTGTVDEPGIDVLTLESQQFLLVGPPGSNLPERAEPRQVLDGKNLIESPNGALMRRIVDDLLADGGHPRIIAEVGHRTSILPLVLAGVGFAVLSVAWERLARQVGAEVCILDAPARLRVVLMSRSEGLSPAAEAFYRVAQAYRPIDADMDEFSPPSGGADPASDLHG